MSTEEAQRPQVRRALGVGAHPDDIDFGAAGTVAGWVRQGIEVTYLLCTRGEQGGFDDTPRDQVPAIREREQQDAAAAVGVCDVRWLQGYRDGYLEVSHDLVRDIARVVRQVRPHRMLIQSPERNWRLLAASHHDHLAAGEASLRAVYPAARNPHAYPELLAQEGLDPWIVTELWLAADPHPDHFEDITAVLDHKVAALRAHRSQTERLGEELEPMVRRMSTPPADAPQGVTGLVEGFRIVRLD